MEYQIKEDKILEFKSLVMKRAVFDQLQEVEWREWCVEAGTYEAKFIGWVNVGGEYYIGEAKGALVRVTRFNLWYWILQRIGGKETALKEAEEKGTTLIHLVASKLDEYRDSLPQVFVV